MLRAASIGLGWWSNELAAAIQGKSEKIGIASCYSRSPDKRRKFAETFNTGTHETMEAVLADPAIDAVILTTPHSLHAAHVTAAARAGKHVFVEKPFTLDAASGERAARACRDAGVVLAVGHNRRYSAVTQAIKEMAVAGEFGEILHIETNFSAPSAMNWNEAHWRASRAESPAGGLAGMGVHMIDMFTFIAGPVERVLANARHRVLKVDVEDTTSALFDLRIRRDRLSRHHVRGALHGAVQCLRHKGQCLCPCGCQRTESAAGRRQDGRAAAAAHRHAESGTGRIRRCLCRQGHLSCYA